MAPQSCGRAPPFPHFLDPLPQGVFLKIPEEEKQRVHETRGGQRGEDRRQYREDQQRLYESRGGNRGGAGNRVGRIGERQNLYESRGERVESIADNTEGPVEG